MDLRPRSPGSKPAVSVASLKYPVIPSEQSQFDVLVIPRGSKHKREAFEFIAYVNRPEVMEKLNRLHCKNSPRKVVSEQFIFTHPNPYIDIFNRLADSPNAQGSLPTPLAPHVGSELGNAITAIATLSDSVDAAMQTAAERIDRRHAKFQKEEQRRQEAQARQQAQNRPQALNHQPPEQP